MTIKRKLIKPQPEGEEARKKIMEFLEERIKKIDPVSFQELADHLGCSKSVIFFHLDRLEREGKIRREKEKARVIEVVGEEE